jgi:hypothetical protein
MGGYPPCAMLQCSKKTMPYPPKKLKKVKKKLKKVLNIGNFT